MDLSNKRDYAIKVLDKRHIIREKKVKYVNIEKNVLYKLDHPGVVKLYSTFQDSSSLCKLHLRLLFFCSWSLSSISVTRIKGNQHTGTNYWIIAHSSQNDAHKHIINTEKCPGQNTHTPKRKRSKKKIEREEGQTV